MVKAQAFVRLNSHFSAHSATVEGEYIRPANTRRYPGRFSGSQWKLESSSLLLIQYVEIGMSIAAAAASISRAWVAFNFCGLSAGLGRSLLGSKMLGACMGAGGSAGAGKLMGMPVDLGWARMWIEVGKGTGVLMGDLFSSCGFLVAGFEKDALACECDGGSVEGDLIHLEEDGAEKPIDVLGGTG